MKYFRTISLVSTVFLLSSCTNNETYERDTSPGEVVTITLDDVDKKIADKETFLIVLSQSTCEHCILMSNMIYEYKQDHRFTLFNVTLDAEVGNENTIKKRIHINFPNFEITPSLYYVENGKLKDELQHPNSEITEKSFDTFIMKHKIDEMEK